MARNEAIATKVLPAKTAQPGNIHGDNLKDNTSQGSTKKIAPRAAYPRNLRQGSVYRFPRSVSSLSADMHGSVVEGEVALSFRVYPDGVRGFAGLVARASEDAQNARTYLDQNSTVGWADGGLIQLLVGRHDSVVTDVRAGLDRVRLVFADSTAELRSAAEYYRSTDLANAERLDRTLPSCPRTSSIPDRPRSVPGEMGPFAPFSDRAKTEAHLTPPSNPEEIRDPLELFNAVDDFLSPSAWLNWVLDVTIGVNPLEEVTKVVAGDWESYARCADAFNRIGHCVEGVAVNVGAGNRELAVAWEGNAADAANYYFDFGSKTVGGFADSLHRAHGQYMTAARGVWHTSKLLSDILKEILDNAIVAAVAAAVGTATAETVVGPVIGYAAAAYEIMRIIELWGDATKLISNAQNIVNGVAGVLQSIELTSELRASRLPAIAYDNPAVN